MKPHKRPAADALSPESCGDAIGAIGEHRVSYGDGVLDNRHGVRGPTSLIPKTEVQQPFAGLSHWSIRTEVGMFVILSGQVHPRKATLSLFAPGLKTAGRAGAGVT